MQRAILAIITAAAWLLTLVTSAAGAPSKHPELYTLSSWKSRLYHKWDFSLFSKTYWYTAGSVAELKQQLSNLPPGSSIEWYSPPGTDFVYPPEPMFSDIRRFLSEHHFKLVFTHTSRKL
jgi:hypothetical protein